MIEDLIFANAVRQFWDHREHQLSKQQQSGIADQGMRGAATGGQQMNGFINTITRCMQAAGVSSDAIHTKLVELPGYFRPNKRWDLIVIEEGKLLAAIELKSHVGPSFGNNFNNRTEEAMGSALDLWTAFREGAFELSTAPWLGYLLLLEDCPNSQKPVAVAESHFPVFEPFRHASYARRYEEFCLRLIRERQYQACCLLLADRAHAREPANYIEPRAELSAQVFLDSLLRQVRKGLGNS